MTARISDQGVADLRARVKAADKKHETVLAQLVATATECTDLREILRAVAPDAPETAGASLTAEAAADPRRGAFIHDLLAAVRFFQDNPAIPMPAATDIHIFPRGKTGAEERAGVDALASLIGLTASRRSPSSHYKATHKFGDLLALTIVSCTPPEPATGSAEALQDAEVPA